jgi:hypothetical protein
MCTLPHKTLSITIFSPIRISMELRNEWNHDSKDNERHRYNVSRHTWTFQRAITWIWPIWESMVWASVERWNNCRILSVWIWNIKKEEHLRYVIVHDIWHAEMGNIYGYRALTVSLDGTIFLPWRCFVLSLLQAQCANHQWVPYDTNISPVVNLFDKPDDLDPQPEYPLRSELVYYKQEDQPAPNLNVLSMAQGHDGGVPQIPQPASIEGAQTSPFPSFTLMLILWVFGLVMWCMTFMNRGAMGGVGGKRGRNKNPSSYEDK